MHAVRFQWRGKFNNQALNRLHAEAFGHRADEHAWRAQVRNHSLGWVCAFDGDALVGFVNVAWDGGLHAFILDTAVSAAVARRGVGTKLVSIAADGARAAGCQWLHVDFDGPLRQFYIDACGFTSTTAGLIKLAAT